MEKVFILGIESSCDETSAAVICNEMVLSNVIAGQELVHRFYGGVVPELASRAHQQKIIPVVEEALRKANITKNELHAVAFTRGPGLMGALLVGVSFAKSFAMGLNIPSDRC
jgi:N6-L-threonylcarbamoyladenine synthase